MLFSFVNENPSRLQYCALSGSPSSLWREWSRLVGISAVASHWHRGSLRWRMCVDVHRKLRAHNARAFIVTKPENREDLPCQFGHVEEIAHSSPGWRAAGRDFHNFQCSVSRRPGLGIE
jgi:hypothetical protein